MAGASAADMWNSGAAAPAESWAMFPQESTGDVGWQERRLLGGSCLLLRKKTLKKHLGNSYEYRLYSFVPLFFDSKW